MSEITIPYPLEGFRITVTHCRNQTIEIHATSTGSTSHCPHCGIASSRKHGWYRRSVQDLPIQKYKVVLKLQINRYRCDQGACPRRTFAESPTTLVGRYQRQTHQLSLAWVALGMALGGEAGSALGQHLSLPSSGDTLLRRVVQHPVPAVEEPTVVGIDDWAWKKRFRYGSIVVDLERNRPLALLPSRDAPSVSAWFKQHPSIRVVSRDRSGEYRRAIEVGAPQATQVADRWHLLVNLRTTLETALAPFATTIRQTLRHPISSPTTAPVSENPSDAAKADQARFVAMQARHAAGATQKAIAAEFNLHPRTVQRWLRANGPPPGKRAPHQNQIPCPLLTRTLYARLYECHPTVARVTGSRNLPVSYDGAGLGSAALQVPCTIPWFPARHFATRMAFHSTSRATEFPTTGVVERSCPDSGVAVPLFRGASFCAAHARPLA